MCGRNINQNIATPETAVFEITEHRHGSRSSSELLHKTLVLSMGKRRFRLELSNCADQRPNQFAYSKFYREMLRIAQTMLSQDVCPSGRIEP